jgi:hypothetical protein
VRTTKTFSIAVPRALAADLERVAAAQGRSRSSLLGWLIHRAVEQEIHEDRECKCANKCALQSRFPRAS